MLSSPSDLNIIEDMLSAPANIDWVSYSFQISVYMCPTEFVSFFFRTCGILKCKGMLNLMT